MKSLFFIFSLLMVTNVSAGDWIGAPSMALWSLPGLLQGLKLGTEVEIQRRAKQQLLTEEDIVMVRKAGISLPDGTKAKIQTTEPTQ